MAVLCAEGLRRGCGSKGTATRGDDAAFGAGRCGFLEPVFYLFSIGVGVGQLVTGFEFNGESIPYADWSKRMLLGNLWI